MAPDQRGEVGDVVVEAGVCQRQPLRFPLPAIVYSDILF